MSLQAITLAQPWPRMMLLEGTPKRIENRAWAPPRKLMGGYLALHGGRVPKSAAEIAEARAALEWAATYVTGDPLEDLEELTREEIQGLSVQGVYAVAKVSRVVDHSDDPWFTGTFGWVLTDFVSFEPVACKGDRNLWFLPEDILNEVRRRWVAARKGLPTPEVQALPTVTNTPPWVELPPDPAPRPHVPALFCPGHLTDTLPDALNARQNHMYAFQIGDEWATVTRQRGDQGGFMWRAMRAGTTGQGDTQQARAFLADLAAQIGQRTAV